MAMATSLFWPLLAALLAACLTTAVQHGEEDFAFEPSATDQVDELPSPMAVIHTSPTPPPVQRMWGIPDTIAPVGRLFHLRIPQDAFSGGIDHYEARGQGNSPLPTWLLFDKSSGLFEGVPTAKDAGEKYLTVRAVGAHAQDWAKDVFSIDVADKKALPDSTAIPTSGLNHKVECAEGEDATIVKIVMDIKYEQLKPKQRVAAIKNLAGFLALHYSIFQLVPHRTGDELLVGDAVVLAGPGNVKRRASKHSSVLQWRVGCDGRLFKPHSSLVAQLKQQASDGTIAEVIRLPVIGWHVETRSSKANRERREIGSGDYGDGEESDYEYEEDLDEGITESIPESRIVPTMVSPVFPEATSVHAHRHHHGEEEVPVIDTSLPDVTSVIHKPPSSPVLYGTIVSTPVLIPIRPTRLPSSGVAVEPSRAYNEIVPSATPVFTEIMPSVSPEISTEEVTEPLPTSFPPVVGVNDTDEIPVDTASSSSSTEASSTATVTETEPITSPPSQSTPQSTTQRATEEILIGTKNIRPTVDHRLPRIPVTAGKALRYIIPENAFSDLEDGNTRHLRLLFKDSDGRPVPSTSWVQFNPASQEIYALPLEEHVSKWNYIIEAIDRDNGSVSDQLELLIQHHKGRRTVNYEFSLHLHIEKSYEFPSNVDWQLRVLDGLARLYGNPDASQITVLNITNTNPVVFSWTNDSLPRSNCPKSEIDDLRNLLVNEKGEPSLELKDILPEFVVKRVTYRGLGQCEISGKLDVRIPLPPIRNPQENYPPVLRNHVDHINATVGELLVFSVPEDSFYDPEDGNTRSLKLSLLTIERLPISPSHWLQFDVKNQEFYGIPMASDQGQKEYQLVCEDSGGRTANDGLIVVVHPAPRLQYNVEFSMRLNTPYEAFVQSASMKRKFLEKLRELFGDRNTSAISLSGVIEGSTIVTWHNRSLPTDACPEEEISKLKQVLMKDDESISDRVNQVLGHEFQVMNIALTPTGLCQGELTVIHTPDGPPPPVDDVQSPSYSDEYLITYIVPAVIIAAMLILAGIVACILYRRRRTGKMSVGDEDERQSFRNKGIPVIFQDELEERPDPENKSPVIMKEEKPPLPPPEYRREELERSTPPPTAAHPLLGDQEDPPYQPPPPFTSSRDTGRQNRPKPTPTYRKPPPYVPP